MSKRVRDFLKEDNQKTIVVTFGRFQPPTIGHAKLVDVVVANARKEGAEHRIYPSRTHDPKRNPLSPKDKIGFMKKMFRGANVIDDKDVKNPFGMMHKINEEGYKRVILVVGGDRVRELEKSITKYIGPDKLYQFDHFEVRSAGQRDPDAEGVEGMSASKMRKAAIEGDYGSFELGVGNKTIAKQLWKKLRKAMNIRESIEEDWDKLVELEEAKADKKPVLIAITKSTSSDEKSNTIERIEKACGKRGITFFPVHTNHAFIVDKDLEDNELVIHNYNGENKNITLKTDNTICLVRGGALVDNAGMGLVKVLQESGMFTVNDLEAMKFCQNKMSTALALEQNQISSPRTAFINNEDSITIALEKIGGQFPVIVKTITGAEGIGVMKIESEESLKSVLQTLWKQEAEVIIQEYIEIKYDVRTLVLDGKIIASVKRIKGGKDFRTNKALGSDTAPYKLSKAEKELVMKAYKMSGCYFAGVDHITNKGTHYILEVNGSPGSGAEPYQGYEPPKELSSDNLINIVLDHILNKENWKFTSKEIGYVEYVTIDGVGKLKAKVDTGNGGANSIGADDIKKEGNKVSFKVLGKKFTKPIVQTQRINIGSDQWETRFIVKFDIKFGKKEYKDVTFNLADRDDNTYKVLLSHGFLGKLNYSVNANKTFTLSEKTKPQLQLEAMNVNFGFELLELESQYT
jgi:RimK family alpha-L-glutamate ligase